uniref:G_PROTEIN_RECEP_F1_2 domain-containing protein n=1 Tax=Caenorhabditis tropicalis TaxID=1561998 RepID=A0A1I7TAA1_9PELO
MSLLNSSEDLDLNSNITDHLEYVMTLDKMTEFLSAVICLPGAFYNAILILLILKRTPPQMKSYAVYLLNFAFFDFATCIISFFSCQKVIFSGFSLIYIFYGPCKYVSSWFCYFCHCFECHTLAHSQWILLGSFFYRYSVIRGQTPTIKRLFRNSAAFYSMSFCFLIFYLFDIGDSAELLKIMGNLHPEYHYDDTSIWKNLVLSGNISMFSPITFISIMYMTFPCVPIYCAILYYRHNTLIVLNNPHLNLSPVAKGSHQKLIQALTVQAIIPIFWLVASGIYTMAQFGFISGPIPENITFRLMDCIPMVTPLVTIWFIAPYRDGLLKFLHTGSGMFVPNTIGTSIVDQTTTTVDTANNKQYILTQL